ncbi:hypothetical protein V2J09_000339 [Rumex salicifolius]
MVVSVIASTASGKQPLRDHVLKKTMEACDHALELDSAKKKLLDFAFCCRKTCGYGRRLLLRVRVCRALASKSALAARIDRLRGDPTGNRGRNLREVIRSKIDKWQQLPPPNLPKALPLPHDLTGSKKERGRRRLRKRKERDALTDVNRKGISSAVTSIALSY